MEILQVAKKIKILVIIFILFQSCVSTKFNSTDKRACMEYEKKLAILSDFLFFEKMITDTGEEPFATFFENITGHKSEADIQYDGQQPSTINDYQIWTSWYVVNHNRLRYDKKKKEIYLIPE